MPELISLAAAAASTAATSKQLLRGRVGVNAQIRLIRILDNAQPGVYINKSTTLENSIIRIEFHGSFQHASTVAFACDQ